MEQVQRIAISVPKDMAEKAEKVRSRLGYNRSKLYQIALKAYLDGFPDEGEYKIAKTYQDIQVADKKLLKEYGRHTTKKIPPYLEKK